MSRWDYHYGYTQLWVSIPTPVVVPAAVTSGWAMVSAGGGHACAIAFRSRWLYCWGTLLEQGVRGTCLGLALFTGDGFPMVGVLGT